MRRSASRRRSRSRRLRRTGGPTFTTGGGRSATTGARNFARIVAALLGDARGARAVGDGTDAGRGTQRPTRRYVLLPCPVLRRRRDGVGLSGDVPAYAAGGSASD